MKKNVCLLLPISWLSLLSCNPMDGADQQIVNPIAAQEATAFVASANDADPLLADSINAYRPRFGDATTVRLFPFGVTGQPTTPLRLMKVSYNGRVVRSYQYNDQNRLAERTDYYTNGIQIYKRHTYNYDDTGLIRVATRINKDAAYVEGFPKTNDLLPSATVTYIPKSDSIAWTQKTTVAELMDRYQKAGTTEARLGFSPKGELIWEEKSDEQGQLNQYTLYRRSQAGNVVFRRTGSAFKRWANFHFAYDNKPNPFLLTGDLQSIDLGDLNGMETFNKNNVLTQSSVNSDGGRDQWRYEYEYRPDGYPNRLTTFRNDRLTSTVEFVYNQ